MLSKTPSLTVVFGLPGTGKTTFAKALSARTGAIHLFTDRIRAEMGRRGQYGEGDKTRIYDEMLHQVAEKLGKGVDVIADGTFYRSELRQRFTGLARECGAAIYWIELEASAETVRQRKLAGRVYSEADYEVYEKVREKFEPMETPHLRIASDGQSLEEMVSQALKYIGK